MSSSDGEGSAGPIWLVLTGLLTVYYWPSGGFLAVFLAALIAALIAVPLGLLIDNPGCVVAIIVIIGILVLIFG